MISAVVLAAGRSSRMGRPKLALRLDGVPVLERVLAVLRLAKVDEVVVVLGADADQVRRDVRFGRERVVFNPAYADGMSSSIKLGLGNISSDSGAAIIVLGDQPFLSPSTIDDVVNGYRAGGSPIVVPVFKGERGNPVLFARILFPEIMRIAGDVGARSVLLAHPRQVLEIQVDDSGVLTDIDTPADYDRTSPAPKRVRRKRSPGST